MKVPLFALCLLLLSPGAQAQVKAAADGNHNLSYPPPSIFNTGRTPHTLPSVTIKLPEYSIDSTLEFEIRLRNTLQYTKRLQYLKDEIVTTSSVVNGADMTWANSELLNNQIASFQMNLQRHFFNLNEDRVYTTLMQRLRNMQKSAYHFQQRQTFESDQIRLSPPPDRYSQ